MNLRYSVRMRPTAQTRRSVALPLAATLLALVPLSGCLKRTISVTTTPPGAIVWINDVEVGRTPLETDFTFFGNYDVRLRREGYEAITTNMKVKAPLHETPPIDLAAEAIPAKFETKVAWHFDLVPVAENAGDKLAAERAMIERATAMRALNAPPAAKAEDPKPEEPKAGG